MKLIAAFLLFIFLVPEAMACTDEAPAEEHESEQRAECDCDSSEEGDFCSPFCHCQCCSIPYVSFKVFTFKVLSPENPQAGFAFFEEKEQEVLYSFRQPPRV